MKRKLQIEETNNTTTPSDGITVDQLRNRPSQWTIHVFGQFEQTHCLLFRQSATKWGKFQMETCTFEQTSTEFIDEIGSGAFAVYYIPPSQPLDPWMICLVNPQGELLLHATLDLSSWTQSAQKDWSTRLMNHFTYVLD